MNRKHRRRRDPIRVGVLVSLLAHGLLVLADPPMPGTTLRPVTRPPVEYLPQLTQPVPAATVPEVDRPVQPARAADGNLPRIAAAPTDSSLPAAPGAAPGLDVAERLEYRGSSLWAPAPLAYESREACRRREIAERVALGIADPTRGNIRLPTDPAPNPRFEAGVRIPVGPKPPPPPVGIRAPLPDSMRTAARPFGEAEYRYETPPQVLKRPPGCAETGALLRILPRDSLPPD